jgi:hypothetical protein
LLGFFSPEFSGGPPIDGIFLSADRRHLTRYNEILLPEFQRFFIKCSLVIVNGTKDPAALGNVKYFGEEGHDTLPIVIIVVRPRYRPS